MLPIWSPTNKVCGILPFGISKGSLTFVWEKQHIECPIQIIVTKLKNIYLS
jgi:hypothetical protein